MAPTVREASADQAEFLDELLAAGLLLDSGVPGVYGHDETFEDVRERLADRLSAEAAQRGAQRLRFPPVLPRRQLESSGYLSSFPHLAGNVYAFDGDEGAAQRQSERAAAHEDWSEFQQPTELSMMPAACYPVYPAIARRGRLPEGGVFVDAGGAWVFRHEPSHDPMRRQIFHQHELVRIGEPDAVLEWRDEWANRGLEILRGLGLPAELDVANDPFFGRRGRMLARNQQADKLKLELLVPIAGPEPTACASFNHHRDHFGSTYGLELADGSTAHTACLGFGHERIVLAMLRIHGLDPARWPVSVRAQLWPQKGRDERVEHD
jgi:seryl-tRNA synthetase